jgi:hypothetical protein
MSPRLVAPVAALLLSLTGCNEYQFSPIGSCVLQPGSVRVELPKTSSADILFVVDDSPSMDPKQAELAANFQVFIRRIVDVNVARTSRGLQPIDFQIAVTTSSIFAATPAATYCVGGSSSCALSTCTPVASCTRGSNAGCGAGQVCIQDDRFDPTFTFIAGRDSRCCAVTSCQPSSSCSPGDRSPVVQTAFPSPLPGNCTAGVATPGAPYPAGRFVSPGGNPRVLTFPKALDWASWTTGTPDPRLVQLVSQFQQNIRVGSCGAGEEQALEASVSALTLAVNGGQPGVAAGTFPRPNAKLVVVFVGDEDDCSSPPSAPLVVAGFAPGADSCSLDKHLTPANQREYAPSRYGAFFRVLRATGHVADLAAAFIVASARCGDGSYAAADVCSGPAWCPVTPAPSCGPPAGICGGAFGAGERFLAVADLLRGEGIAVVEGSVCEPFGPLLAAIADLAPPPSLLRLPTLPAARAMTNVRIVDEAGTDLKTCQAGRDWCFADCAAANGACLATGTSQCIAIDHSGGQCEANPGETYSADYLGMLPAGGCATAAECASALGGSASRWSCLVERGMSRGTCSCSGS